MYLILTMHFMQINIKRLIFLFTEWSKMCWAIILVENIYVGGTFVLYLFQ